LSHRNALIFQRNFYTHCKEPSPNPSKIRALEFKDEFRRFEIYSVSRTIDVQIGRCLAGALIVEEAEPPPALAR
jgi:hypothetical protein